MSAVGTEAGADRGMGRRGQEPDRLPTTSRVGTAVRAQLESPAGHRNPAADGADDHLAARSTLIERRQEQRGILSGFFIRSALLPTAVLGLIAVVSCQGRPAPATLNGALPSQFTAGVSARIDSLDQALAALDDLPKRSTSATVRQAFAAARAAYKRLEYLVEFEDPLRTRALNSPPITILDEDDHTHLIRPTGLQVIEASIYPSLSRDFAKVTRRETTSMRLALAVARHDSSGQASRTWQLPFQAARMELARVATLGLAGYDATLSEEGIHESAYALRGIT